MPWLFLEQDGEQIILSLKPKSWRNYFAQPKHFTDDFLDHIEDLFPEERESLT